MLTVFILANDDAKALTRTLNTLVGATVDGLVRDVIVVADVAHVTAATLADEAGCALIAASQFAEALHSAKGDWLMVLEGGALPEQNWAEAVTNHIQFESGAAHFSRSPLAPRTLLQRLFQQEKQLALGLIISKQNALGLGSAALKSPQALAAAAKAKPISAALRPASNAHPSAA